MTRPTAEITCELLLRMAERSGYLGIRDLDQHPAILEDFSPTKLRNEFGVGGVAADASYQSVSAYVWIARVCLDPDFDEQPPGRWITALKHPNDLALHTNRLKNDLILANLRLALALTSARKGASGDAALTEAIRAFQSDVGTAHMADMQRLIRDIAKE
jgi:hypothetical protein